MSLRSSNVAGKAENFGTQFVLRYERIRSERIENVTKLYRFSLSFLLPPRRLTRDVCKSCQVLNCIIFKFIFLSTHTVTKFRNLYLILFKGYTNTFPENKEVEAFRWLLNFM